MNFSMIVNRRFSQSASYFFIAIIAIKEAIQPPARLREIVSAFNTALWLFIALVHINRAAAFAIISQISS